MEDPNKLLDRQTPNEDYSENQKQDDTNIDHNVSMTMEESGETTDTSSEKNESRDYIDDDDQEMFQCKDCEVTQCTMWRKALDKDGLVCNLCHLKRVKNKMISSQTSTTTTTCTTATTSTTSSTTSSVASNSAKSNQMQPPIRAKDVRISKRKNKINKKFANGAYADRLIKTNNSKSRRAFYKKKPRKSEAGVASIVASQSVYHNVCIK